MSKSGRLYMDKLEEAHAMIQELVDALERAYEKLQIECGGQREYKGGMPTQFLFPLIEKILSKARQGETV